MYVDDVKIFVIVFNQHIRMEFRIEKCALLTMNKEKAETTKGIELSNQKSIGTLGEKESRHYFKAGIIKQTYLKDGNLKRLQKDKKTMGNSPT